MDIHSVEIISQIQLSPRAFLLSFKRNFEFKAGQTISLTTSKSIPPRLYSICSGSNTNTLSILYTLVPTGVLTPQLAKLGNGDKIFISEPMGSFIHKEKQGFWIASGTGIAPFISMLESNIIMPYKLLHGIKTMPEAYYSNFLSSTLGNTYTPCLSRESKPNTFHGRITEWLKQTEAIPLDIMYYLCGRPEMVVDVRDILIEKGVPFKQITSEIYF